MMILKAGPGLIVEQKLNTCCLEKRTHESRFAWEAACVCIFWLNRLLQGIAVMEPILIDMNGVDKITKTQAIIPPQHKLQPPKLS